MTFHASASGRTPVVTQIGYQLCRMTVCDSWAIHDDETPIAMVFTGDGYATTGATYAQRIAELLNRHGMADVPVDLNALEAER